MQVSCLSVEFRFLSEIFVIFGIGNEYQNIYADLYKLKSGFNGGYVKKSLQVSAVMQ